MATRTCPNCLTVVSPATVVVFSDGMECPGCKRSLTVWDGSRLLASLAGILAGLLAWQLSYPFAAAPDEVLGWAMPVVYAFLAFGAVASLVLMGTADLRLKPDEGTAAPLAPAGGHAHGSGSH
jgi:hypothetical protein